MQIKSQPAATARANITPIRGNLEGFLKSESRAHQSSVLARAAQASPGVYAVPASQDPFAAPWSTSPRSSPSPGGGSYNQHHNNQQNNRLTITPSPHLSPRVNSPTRALSPSTTYPHSSSTSRPTSPLMTSNKSRHMQRAQSPSPRQSPGGGGGGYLKGSPAGSPTMWRPSLGSDPFEAGTTRTYGGELSFCLSVCLSFCFI